MDLERAEPKTIPETNFDVEDLDILISIRGMTIGWKLF